MLVLIFCLFKASDYDLLLEMSRQLSDLSVNADSTFPLDMKLQARHEATCLALSKRMEKKNRLSISKEDLTTSRCGAKDFQYCQYLEVILRMSLIL